MGKDKERSQRGMVIKTGFLLGGLCLAAWSAPRLLERIEQMRGGGVSSMLPAEASAMLEDVLPGGGGDAVGGPKVISPNGEQLTREQQDALLRQAEAMAPIPLDREERMKASGGKKKGSRPRR